MRLGGRIAGAIEVLTDIREQYTPVTAALRDWGKKNRYAGSKDRSFIGNLVLDALRKASSIGWMMDADSPRALILGAYIHVWDKPLSELQAAFKDDAHAPEALAPNEVKHLTTPIALEHAPDWIKADVPEWLWPAFNNNFADEAVAEGQALSERPPLDLRVNPLKSAKVDALKAIEKAKSAPISPLGLRIEQPPAEGRLPNVQIEPIYQTGGVEIQDEGSQIVSALVNLQPGEAVLDYCAGAGGKSLGMAAFAGGPAKIYAYDIDKRRLAPTYQRAMRAGVDIEIIGPPFDNLRPIMKQMDKVLIDAPCTGSGTWRRKPDAKWRLSPETLEQRCNEQEKVLEQARGFLKPGGLMCYVTCSVFAEENEAQIYNFLEKNKDFELLSAGEVWEDIFGTGGPKPWSEDGCTVTLTPASTQTDGFFFAVMQKTG